MKTHAPKALAFLSVTLILCLLCLLSACGQSGDAQSAENSASSKSPTATESQESADDQTAGDDQSSEAAKPSTGQTKQSFFDAAKGIADKAKGAADKAKEKAADIADNAKEKATDIADKAKEKAADVADAAAKAKEEAERKAADAAAAKEEAKRKAAEEKRQREEAEAKAKEEAERKAAEEQKRLEEEAKARTAKELKKTELTRKTKVLEYSSKKAKPLKLVECSDNNVEVTSDGKISLTELGNKKVTYTLSLDGQSIQRKVNFKIRDTKPPKIDFVSRKPKVELGASYNPIKNINYVKDPVDGKLERVDVAPPAQGTKAGKEVFYDKGWYTVEGYIDTSVAGVYPIDVTAADIHGNTAHRTFDVTVVAPEPEPTVAPVMHDYVLNTNTGKFHYPWCRSVRQMKDWNRSDVTATREDVISRGYAPCQICNP